MSSWDNEILVKLHDEPGGSLGGPLRLEHYTPTLDFLSYLINILFTYIDYYVYNQ